MSWWTLCCDGIEELVGSCLELFICNWLISQLAGVMVTMESLMNVSRNKDGALLMKFASEYTIATQFNWTFSGCGHTRV